MLWEGDGIVKLAIALDSMEELTMGLDEQDGIDKRAMVGRSKF